MLGYPSAGQFLFISYEVGPDQFDKGVGDAYFVFFWTIMFTFLRASFIKYGYLPLANYFDIADPSKRQRVAEQMYIFAYYVVFGAAGLVSFFFFCDIKGKKSKKKYYFPLVTIVCYVQRPSLV